jgi:creatinine amidohydrolase
VTAAFSELHAERSLDPRSNAPGIRCALRNWWTGPGVQKLSKELFGDSEGSHATPSEVAVTQYAFPDSIKSATLEPKVAPRGSFHDADDYRRKFPDGRIGSNPGLATPEAGKRLYDVAVDEVASDYLKFIADDAVGR